MLFFRPGPADTLLYMTRGNRAVRADVVRCVSTHLAEHRPADLHRIFVVLGFNPPGPVVTGAALDGIHRGSGHELERFAGLLPDVLHARMTRNVIRHVAKGSLEIGLEQPVALAQDEVLKRIERRPAHGFHLRILRKQQRQFVLEHQGARRHGGKDRVAFAGELGERRNIRGLEPLDPAEVAKFELGHAATCLFDDNDVGNLVMFENREQIEISKFYERMPKPTSTAMEEFLENKLNFRYRNEGEGNPEL